MSVQWDKEDSDEPQGWYLAKVISVSSVGTATVLYRKGKMLETLNLFETNWFPAPGNGKWYFSSPPPYSYHHMCQTLNLQRWRLRPDAKCPLCDNPWPTVQHILNGCPVSLAQGKYTWRHDSALKILANGLREYLQPGERLYMQIYQD